MSTFTAPNSPNRVFAAPNQTAASGGHPDTPHPEAAAAPTPSQDPTIPAKPVPSQMTKAQIKTELRALRSATKYNLPKADLEAALLAARQGFGLLPTTTVVGTGRGTVAPQWTQVHMVRLIEIVAMLAHVVTALVNGRTREDLDTGAPSPWTRVAEAFNTDEIDPWADPPDEASDLAVAAATPPPDTHHRTWRYLKEKWGQLRSAYTVPLARYNASGQGDPDAAFANFLHAGDPHPKVLTYLHYRLQSIDTSAYEGMGSRLIRHDAVNDNDDNYQPSRQRRRTSGGFLAQATEQDLARLFAAAQPDTTAQRLDVMMSHYPHLSDELRARVDVLIEQQVQQLEATIPAATSPAATVRSQPRRRRHRPVATPSDSDEDIAQPDELLLSDGDEGPAPVLLRVAPRVLPSDSEDDSEDDSDI